MKATLFLLKTNTMKSKLIIIVCLTMFFANACNIKVESQQNQNDDQIPDKVSDEKTNGQNAENHVADNTQEGVKSHRFINLNKNSCIEYLRPICFNRFYWRIYETQRFFRVL